MSKKEFQQMAVRLPQPAHPANRRLLVIVNPYATTVSSSLKQLVIYALEGRYKINYVETEQRGHAIELAREAAREEYDAVVAFGGDGTVNEVANGLIGSETALACLPGGSTNVYCRMLGVPLDIVDATEYLLRLSDSWQTKTVDVGRVNDRYFLFTSDTGFGADIASCTDRSPKLKARFRQYYFGAIAIRRFFQLLAFKRPSLVAQIGDEQIEGSNVTVQNGDYYSFFGKKPIFVVPDKTLNDGTLGAIVLVRNKIRDMPSMLIRAVSGSKRMPIHRHKTMSTKLNLEDFTVKPIDPDQLLPVHVDGDYIGSFKHAHYQVKPDSLKLLI